MSGTNASQRQWTTGHVRVLAAVLLALSMLISTGLVALAQSDVTAQASQYGVLCISSNSDFVRKCILRESVAQSLSAIADGTSNFRIYS